MPRKFFRKYLPDGEQVRRHRWIAPFARWLKHSNLWHLNRDSVARAVAIGLFAGLVPGPLQVLTALLLGVPLRCNLPVAIAVTFYTNPFTIVPLYLLAYGYGAFLIGHDSNQAHIRQFEMDWSNLYDSMGALVAWMLGLGKPLAVGLPALALTLAVAGYFAVQLGWRAYVIVQWRARRRRRREKQH